MKYRYAALDRAGERHEGHVFALSVEHAENLLKRRFAVVQAVRVCEGGDEAAPAPASVAPLSLDQQSIFLRQLATILRAGITIRRALEMIEADAPSRVQCVVLQVRQHVQSGHSLAESLRRSGAFMGVVYHVVRAAEISGQMDLMLDRMAGLFERAVRLKKKLVASLAYPATLLMITGLVVLFLAVFVLPQARQLYSMSGGLLPLPTRMLLGIVGCLSSPLSWLVLLAALAGLADVARRTMASEQARRRLDRLFLHLPVVGKVLGKAAAARLLYGMALATEAGMTMGREMEAIEPLAGNYEVQQRFHQARQLMMQGSDIYDSLEQRAVFPRLAMDLIRAGHEAGELPHMMRQAARILEEEVDHAIEAATTALEPLLLCLMGGVVGFVAIAATLPLIRLIDQL